MLESMLALGKMHFRQYSIYKSNFYLFTLNRIVEIAVYIFVWQAIYNQTGNAGGFTISQMTTYYILVFALSSLATWGINEDMAHSIRNGNINKELLNPLSYFQYYFGVNLGELAFAIVVGIATFIICSVFWGISLPVNLMNCILFFIVIILGIPITFFLQMIVGITGFYTSSIWGMQILRKSVISIFSGIIAPLTLFPNWFQDLANILPFKELIYTPINIYNKFIKILITIILPFAFVAYFPTMSYLGKNSYMIYLSPVVVIILWFIAIKIWNFALSKYRSTGN